MSKTKKKSQIFGDGYGSSHVWVRGHTNQGDFNRGLSPSEKATYYHCDSCKATFAHRYDMIPNIFRAIENAGVPDKCKTK